MLEVSRELWKSPSPGGMFAGRNVLPGGMFAGRNVCRGARMWGKDVAARMWGKYDFPLTPDQPPFKGGRHV